MQVRGECCDAVAQAETITSVTCELHAQLKNDKDVNLLGNLDDEGQNLFAEQRIEAFLNIRDQAVPGKVQR